ncbi:MAG: hypothetical protein PHH28_05775 [Desulfuromonadaceae bacterium]|nr:hypothetical protein [Desulfuromonadaceae bacterium]
MKIGIGFFGLPRSTDLTFESIDKYILQPAASLGTVLTRYHLYQQTHVVNSRSNENSILTPNQYAPFSALQGELQRPEGVAESYGLTTIAKQGDTWNDNLQSLRNHLLQLHSLRCVTQQLEEISPDIVIFVRPDLCYHQSFEQGLRAILENRARTVRLPFWQWAGGYNDRFAICTKDAFAVYGRRIEQIQLYLKTYPKKPLHAERLLRFTLDKELIAVRRLDVQATRIRVNGDEAKEDFSLVQANRLIRWGVREVKKSVLGMLKGKNT